MIIQDDDFGNITVNKNIRSKRIKAGFRNGVLTISCPYFITENELIQSINRLRSRLLILKQTQSEQIKFYPQCEFYIFGLTLSIVEHNLDKLYMTYSHNSLNIGFPSPTNFDNDVVQDTIKSYIEKVLRVHAKQVFTTKLNQLASQWGFIYKTLKINKSRTRWGSCSSIGNINLSYFCLLLPEHLIDLILLHELCHTQEMNHGEKFWLLLNKFTLNQAKQLTKELKSYKINW